MIFSGSAELALKQLPTEFTQRLEKIIPTEVFGEVLASFAKEKRFTFRVNSLSGPRLETLGEISRMGIEFGPVPWLLDEQGEPIAFQANRVWRGQLTRSLLAEQGRIYLQNVSSLLAPWVLGATPGESVLDLAAAPGGKTTQLAQQMNNEGQLAAVECIRTRMYKLQANLKRCGVTNCKTYLTDGRTVGKKTPERFDRVLLDAPCSSESRFRVDDPSSWDTWSPRKIRETSRKQIGLLKAALHATKVGGTIVYCTCSFAPEENEQVVDKVLRKFGEAVEIVPIELPLSNSQPGLTSFEHQDFSAALKNGCRILPNEVHDGFFLAKLRKLGRTTIG